MAVEAGVPRGAILVAIDGSPTAKSLVAAAERVARARDAAVHVVHVRESRILDGATAELEDAPGARSIVDAAVGRLSRAGVPGATGEVLHGIGHHAAAADVVLDLAQRTGPAAVIVGRPAAHGGDPGAPSLARVLTEQAPCNVVVVAV